MPLLHSQIISNGYLKQNLTAFHPSVLHICNYALGRGRNCADLQAHMESGDNINYYSMGFVWVSFIWKLNDQRWSRYPGLGLKIATTGSFYVSWSSHFFFLQRQRVSPVLPTHEIYKCLENELRAISQGDIVKAVKRNHDLQSNFSSNEN